MGRSDSTHQDFVREGLSVPPRSFTTAILKWMRRGDSTNEVNESVTDDGQKLAIGPGPERRAWLGVSRKTAYAVLFVWFVAMGALGVSLLARHEAALPVPEANGELAGALSSLREADEKGQWMAVHVLYTECRCSQRLLQHLLETTRPTGTSEHVLLVGHDEGLEQKLRAKSFRVTNVESTELGDRYHVTAVPLLVIAAPDGSIRYAGGYTTHKQGPDPRDLQILAEARSTGSVLGALPIFGCAVSERLKKILNPLGIP